MRNVGGKYEQTRYKTEEDLRDAYVDKVKKVSEDFIVIELLPF